MPKSTSNQFEQALEDLGIILGFTTQRPDSLYSKGPDVLWLLNDEVGLVMEVKSRKEPKNPLTKDEYGQLLNAEEWFKKEYPNYNCIRVSVHPNNLVTESVITDTSKVLTPDKLSQLITDTQSLIQELCESNLQDNELTVLCENLLNKSLLKPESLTVNYFTSFVVAEKSNTNF